MYPINNRLAALPDLLDYESPAALAKACGIDPNTFRKAMQGPSKPGYDVLSALITKQPRINPEWLLTGAGPILREQAEAPSTQLPPQVPSKLEPSKPSLPTPGEATPLQADFVGRLIAQLEAENARKDTLIEWLQEQNAALLKKPLASIDAAGYMVADRTEISLRPTACQPAPMGKQVFFGDYDEAGQRKAA